MQSFTTTGIRLLVATGLVAVTLNVSSTPLAGGSAGREFSRCIQTCNETRRTCEDRCAPDCAALFPDNKSARNACISACKSACGEESGECKLRCLADKNEETPTEP
ncbi:MAG TPA: hypothetical protein VJV23_07345 [Candidatus Polarisedimenticolia bacterium]|nr:hypothetical protein [Candidatus Polarisedimenticolia bacterium]